MESHEKTFVIAGHGLSAWMTAAALAHALDRDQYSIRVVSDGQDDEQPDAVETADASLPWPGHTRVALDLMDERMVIQSGGAFSLGIALSGWSSRDATWFHPFSSLGASLGSVPFHQIVTRLRGEGASLKLANYSLAALAAQAGRLAPADSNPQHVLSTCRRGLHVGVAALTGKLRLAAKAAGVTQAEGRLETVQRQADGSIESLLTRTGERVEGKLYLDCTGTAARLSGKASQAAWEDWLDWMPCNRIVSAEVATSMAPLPYSHAEANEGGWTRYLPLQTKTVLSGFYDENSASESSVVARFRRFAGAQELEAVTSGEFRTGQRASAWRQNCLALGSAAALTDPVGVSNLQLLRFGINRLLQLLPASPAGRVEAAEYNRQSRALLNNVRDFTALHYALNGRQGEPFWDACRTMPLSDALNYRVRLYEDLGRVALYDEEPLEETSWIHLFDEQGIRPRQHSAIADGIDSATLKAHLDRVRAVMIDSVGKMPLHSDYLSNALGQRPAETRSNMETAK